MKAKTNAANGPNNRIRIYTDGAGCRPDGEGSGFAWFRKDSGQRFVKREDNLTNNQAEYRAILAALESSAPRDTVEILTDSENTCYQLKGLRYVRQPHLIDLYFQINETIKTKQLDVIYTWVPRRDNLAGKLI